MGACPAWSPPKDGHSPVTDSSLRPPEEMMAGTPYLIADGDAAGQQFLAAATRAVGIRSRAMQAAERIAEEARLVLPQFDMAVRSDLVAESNRMEGIDVSASGVRDLVRVKRELLEMDVHSFVQYVRDDPRILESLGLYRAYAVADEWRTRRHDRASLSFASYTRLSCQLSRPQAATRRGLTRFEVALTRLATR
jgi:hypothetical protein